MPAGYESADDITFTVNTDGVVCSAMEGDTIVMYDRTFNHMLTVEKTVSGRMGNRTKDFNFTVYFIEEGEPFSGLIKINGVETEVNESYSFTLKHGERTEFTGVPSYVSARVVEDDYGEEGYTTSNSISESRDTGVFELSDNTTVLFTNIADGAVPSWAHAGFSKGFVFVGVILLLLIASSIKSRHITEE